ncbi:Phosphate ABC superfamily ATP binding cassette transporter, binding protein, partial [human gut metagenome]
FGVQEEQNGEKVDLTTDKAIVTNSTSVMLTTVAGDKSAIGYASLGSLDHPGDSKQRNHIRIANRGGKRGVFDDVEILAG